MPPAPRTRVRPTLTPTAPAVKDPIIENKLKELAKTQLDKAAEAEVSVEDLIAQVFKLNIEQNEIQGKYRKARAKLLRQMRDKGVAEVKAKGDFGIELVALVAKPTLTKIDVVKLKAYIGETRFMEVVSASKTAVTEKVGSEIAEQCETTELGEENVTVKLASKV